MDERGGRDNIVHVSVFLSPELLGRVDRADFDFEGFDLARCLFPSCPPSAWICVQAFESCTKHIHTRRCRKWKTAAPLGECAFVVLSFFGLLLNYVCVFRSPVVLRGG